MRLGILADVHGNVHALDAAVAALRREGVDGYLCAGDLVGYGAFPNECVERVASLGAVCVAGNHDLIALGRLSDERCIPIARESLRWTQEVLTADARLFLDALPGRAVVERIVVAHGSLQDVQEYVVDAHRAKEQLEETVVLAGDEAILVLGHTHRAWAYGLYRGTTRTRSGAALALGDEAWLVNPGAVGQSRSFRALARVAVLDLERNDVTFHALEYDVARCREALRRVGLSVRGCHLPPSARAGAGIRRRLRSLPARLGVRL